MKENDEVKVKGSLKVMVFKNGILVDTWEDRNMVLAAGRSAVAALMAGDVAGKAIARIGFGVSVTPPTPEDSALTDPFIKSIDGAGCPTPEQAQFAWSLAGSEANGKTITEFGLFCSDGTLFARKTRAAIAKEPDISLAGTWTISF